MKVSWKPFGYHKLLLALFGLFLGDIHGFWVGFIIGCIFDGEVIYKEQPKAKKQVDWRVSFLMLGAFVLQVPGVGSKVSTTHIRYILAKHFGEDYASKRFLFMNELLRQRIQVEQICNHLRTDASLEDKRRCLLFLFDLAEIPGVETHNLHHSINYLAARMDIEFSVVQEIYRTFLAGRGNKNQEQKKYTANNGAGNSTSEALLFGKLNLSPKATEREVKKAYYAFAKKYHT